MMSGNQLAGCRYGTILLRLRYVVFISRKGAIFIWTAVDQRIRLEIAVRWRRGSGPFESIAVPWVAACRRSAEQTVEKVDDKDDLCQTKQERADGHDLV